MAYSNPHDFWFQLFRYLGLVVLLAVVAWGLFIAYRDRTEGLGEGDRGARDR